MKRLIWAMRFSIWFAIHYGYNKYPFSWTLSAYDQRAWGLWYLSQEDKER